jgi:hypothetical protein
LNSGVSKIYKYEDQYNEKSSVFQKSSRLQSSKYLFILPKSSIFTKIIKSSYNMWHEALNGSFELQELGEGACGKVYLTYHASSKEPFIIKKPYSDYADGFEHSASILRDEMKTLGLIQDCPDKPSSIIEFEGCNFQDELYLEYFHGDSVGHYDDNSYKLSEAQVDAIASCLLRSLAFMLHSPESRWRERNLLPL